MLLIAFSVWSRDVADADRFPGVEILADLSAQVDHAAGDDRLAEVVVEVLFGVGVLGVEGPDPRCGLPCRRCSLKRLAASIRRHARVVG